MKVTIALPCPPPCLSEGVELRSPTIDAWEIDVPAEGWALQKVILAIESLQMMNFHPTMLVLGADLWDELFAFMWSRGLAEGTGVVEGMIKLLDVPLARSCDIGDQDIVPVLPYLESVAVSFRRQKEKKDGV